MANETSLDKRIEDKDTAYQNSTSLPHLLERLGLRNTQDGSITWNNNNPKHPRNWSLMKKCYDSGIILFLEFFTTVLSGAGPAAAEAALEELHLSRLASLAIFTFTYQFGQAVGGILLPPYSECYGRRNCYLCSTALYSLTCILAGTISHPAPIAIGRFAAGFASAVPSVVIAGSIEDIFNSKQRVWMVLYWNWFTTGGLVCGPIYGAFIVRYLNWKWIFRIGAIGTFINFLLFFTLRESRPSTLLTREIKKLNKMTGDRAFNSHNPDHMPDFASFCRIALIRPLRLFVTDPLVIMVSLISALSWGLIYLFTESIPLVYSAFEIQPPKSSLFFLPIGLGIFLSIGPRILTLRKLHHLETKGQKPKPEDKIIGLHLASPALAIGLWIFAWTIPPAAKQIHWLPSSLGLALVGFAANEMAFTLGAYLSDTYTIFAASAFATLAFWRAVISGILPLVARPMYLDLNANVAGSALAGLATGFCILPLAFSRYGLELRQRSEFARYSLEMETRTHVEDD